MGRLTTARRAVAMLLLGLAAVPSARATTCAGLTNSGGVAGGGAPQMVVLGDFNGDGRLDAAIANGSGTGNTLSICLALPGGGFAAPFGYTGGAKARALALGDLDGDGRTDIVLGVNAGVMLWLGNGDGTFHGGLLVSVGSSPRGIVCADLDGDGIADLVVASSNTNNVQVLRGNGANGIWDGTYAAPVAYAAGTSPARLVAGDWNGDGVLDLACTNDGSHTLSVFVGRGANGRGDGTFTPSQTLAMPGSPFGLARGDFDRDGVADLAVSDAAGSAVTILRGKSDGTFSVSGTAASAFGAEDIACADIDGDGFADLMVACAGPGQLSLLRGKGDGSFLAPTNLASGSGCFGVATGDLNNDGIADAVSVNAGATTLVRYMGACAPGVATDLALLAPNGGDAWWPGQPQLVRWQKGAGVLAVDVDLSRDGGATWTPLARAALGTQITAYTMGATSASMRVRVRDSAVPARAAASAGDFRLCGRFAAAHTQTFGAEPALLLATGDVDGDGVDDAVTAGATQLSVLRGDGNGGFTMLANTPVAAPSRLRLVDADADGRLDVLLVQGANVIVMRGDGAGHLGAPTTWAMPAPVADATFADLDEDGTPDLIAATGGATPQLLTLRGLGAGAGSALIFATAVSHALGETPLRVVCADMDGDGLTDVVTSAPSGLQIWYGQGTGGHGDGSLVGGVLRELPAPLGDLAIADLDGDGRADVLGCVPSTGDLWLLAGAGAAASPRLGATANAFASPLALAGGVQPQEPRIADFDGDGLPDVAVTLAGEGVIALLPGVPGGLSGALRYALPGGARALAVGDFTHAGAPGLLALGADSLRVSVLPAQCPPQIPATIALAPLPAPTAWSEGREVALHWNRAASIALTRVQVSRDDGRTWVTLADGVSGSAFTWSVTGPATDSLRVRVSDASVAARYDVSPRMRVRPLLAPLTTNTTSAALPLPAAGAFTLARRDGRAQLALVDGAAVQVMRGDASGAFTPLAAANLAGASRVMLADFDRDGREDVIAVTPSAVLLRRTLANGALDSMFVVPVASASDVLCRDVDDDGVPDLLVASGTGASSRVQTYHGAGDGGFTFTRQVNVPAAPASLTCGDVNGDGVLDVIVSHSAGVSALLGHAGDGAFTLASTRSLGAGAPREVRVFDMDGDGKLDLVALDSGGAALLIAKGDGAGHFADPVRVALPFAAAGRSLTIADLDGDGRADVAVTGDSLLTLVLSQAIGVVSGGFVPVRSITLGAGARVLGACDMDSDGAVDLVVTNAQGALQVLRGGSAALALAALHLDAPAGGSLTLGSIATLNWSAGAGVLAVDVDLSRDGGHTWENLAQGVQTSALAWLVTGPPTGEAVLRVRDAFSPALASMTLLPLTLEPAALAAGDAPPARAALSNAWPCPARGATSLMLALPQATSAHVTVCDVSGRRVATLAQGVLPAGRHAITWDGRDASGAMAAPGLYFVRVDAGAFHAQQRVVQIR
jgi:hypothetical protein